MILEKPKEKPGPDNKIIGVWARFKVEKSATAVTGITLKYPIKFERVGCAVWKELEVGDLLLTDPDLAKANGAWINIGPAAKKICSDAGLTIEDKVNGTNALYSYLEENPKICDALYDYFVNLSVSQSEIEARKAAEEDEDEEE